MASVHNCCGVTSLLTTLFVIGGLLQNDLVSAAPYYGKRIGSFNTYYHGVRGDVYAASNTRLYITGFYYDGQAPDAFVWMGSTANPSSQGTIIPVDGSSSRLGSYSNKVVELDLPGGTTLVNYKWISIWCRLYGANFGQLVFSVDFTAPAPVSLGRLGYARPVHNVQAEDVIVLNHRQIQLVNLDYDGNAPDAYYWAGIGHTPSTKGFALADESRGGSLQKLPRQSFNDKTVTVTVPLNRGDVFTIGHVGLWCVRFTQDFGHVDIPNTLEVPVYDDPPPDVSDPVQATKAAPAPVQTTSAAPAPVSLGTLGYSPYRVHNVWAEDVIVLNNRQIQLVNLDYDGNGPDAYYWAGSGGTPSASGFALADESRGGSLEKLPRQSFNDKTVTLTIPDNRGDISNIGYVGLWCVAFSQDFGHVDIPSSLNVPEHSASSAATTRAVTVPPTQSSENCQVLIDDTYQVRWSLIDTSSIKISLSARIEPGTYMAFGLSGSETRTLMIGSDVTVAWLDAETGATANVVDYHLSAYQQCVVGSSSNSGTGACTDELSNPSGSNDVTLNDYSNENGIITISYTRPLNTGDTNTDKVIPIDRDVYVAWSIGPINPAGLAAKHRQQPSSDFLFNFGETGQTCPAFTSGQTDKLGAWVIPTIKGDETKTEFQVDIGQAGGQQGYEGITGSPGWGIAWYVDELIIPVLTLQRNVTYTFTVQGGNEADIQARYHPFYITDDPEGGYIQKTEQERLGIEIFAGPVNGSLCEWRSSGSYNPDDFNEFVKYRDTSLERVCDEPKETDTLTWTPDENTPDRVYYQCYTHKFLGWKIDIIDNDSDTMKPGDSSTMEPGDSGTMEPGDDGEGGTGWVIQGNLSSIITMVAVGIIVMM